MGDPEIDSARLFFLGPRKVTLHDHLLHSYGLITSPDAQARLEAQELRQLVHRALRDLTADELQVIELRYQHKKSPGQTASRLCLSPDRVRTLEKRGLDKIRVWIEAWQTRD